MKITYIPVRSVKYIEGLGQRKWFDNVTMHLKAFLLRKYIYSRFNSLPSARVNARPAPSHSWRCHATAVWCVKFNFASSSLSLCRLSSLFLSCCFEAMDLRLRFLNVGPGLRAACAFVTLRIEISRHENCAAGASQPSGVGRRTFYICACAEFT